eukprot:2900328-Prymnesium_polylepis.1
MGGQQCVSSCEHSGGRARMWLGGQRCALRAQEGAGAGAQPRRQASSVRWKPHAVSECGEMGAL